MKHLLIALLTISSLLTIGCDENETSANPSIEKGVVGAQSSLSIMMTGNSWCLETEDVEKNRKTDVETKVELKTTLEFFINGDLTITIEKDSEVEDLDTYVWSLDGDQLRIYTSKRMFSIKKASITNDSQLVLEDGSETPRVYEICEGQQNVFSI